MRRAAPMELRHRKAYFSAHFEFKRIKVPFADIVVDPGYTSAPDTLDMDFSVFRDKRSGLLLGLPTGKRTRQSAVRKLLRKKVFKPSRRLEFGKTTLAESRRILQ